MPWPSLWTVLFKVQEEEIVGEILHSGGVLCHAIGESREVVGFVIVAMLALVVAGFGAQVRGDAVAGDGTFVDAGHRGGVVRSREHCGAAWGHGLSPLHAIGCCW